MIVTKIPANKNDPEKVTILKSV